MELLQDKKNNFRSSGTGVELLLGFLVFSLAFDQQFDTPIKSVG